ncbi:site-specific DNA-methyltransferase [Hymenobacter swuensis]|uniref:DNA methylase N-4/N-6 domain-containing protein n=1 Tax=Hymenobacter swuensis DY53 TaxID=1227739 RepID=W8EYW7_9BACT|nr:DNA methyltransferase [Hymenobacter swuensis]AHJ95531.1 hypothetical protein Hsw_PA0198 [Hymenobacter swuensis DY53]
MTAPASPAYDKLISLLRELFQLDQPDLDFGLYRVLHARAAEIDKFLSHDLLPQVRREFAHYQPADKAAIQKELDKVIASLTEAEIDPETSPKVQALRQRLATEAVDLAGLEREVFDHLYAFFRRYYAEGDFLARRVYKEGTYAIPYEGEEVKLHWANRDQYYIKTSEYLRDYAFRLRPTDKDKPMRVHFRLADAAEGEHGNVKAAEGKDRVFILREGAAVYALDAKAQELTFFFEYRPATADDRPADAAPAKKKADDGKAAKPKPPTQKELLQAAQARIEALAAADAALVPWLAGLTQPHTRADGSLSDKSRLQVNLERYTARNTFDYFIHKDLGGFLQRELDFYLKNEVLHLDNIEADSAPRVEQFLSKLRVLRKVAHHLIDFLAQLEDFQRKLWLKKKFVVETQWCVTLDKVPAALLPEVAANADQRQEWVELFGIEALAADAATPGYSEPLTVGFLQAYSNLMLDTRHFPAAFTQRLLAGLEGDLDELTDGLLIHGENFQALNLLQERYKEQVDCVYIDPPYNTDGGPIMYKNGYRSSSWISLIDSRLNLTTPLLHNGGLLCATIDDYQQKELHYLLEEHFGKNRIAGTVAIRINPSGRPIPSGFGQAHEYAIFARAGNEAVISKLPRTDAQLQRYREADEQGAYMWELFRKRGSESERVDRPTMYYPLFYNGNSLRVPEMSYDDTRKSWVIEEVANSDETVLYPIDENGVERRWRMKYNQVKDEPSRFKVGGTKQHPIVYYKYRPSEGGVIPPTVWIEAKYSAAEHGTSIIKGLFGENVFSYPKSIYAVEDCLRLMGMREPKGTVIDYFAGSGTTGHAVVNLNRESGGKRKFILVEMGEHFDAVILPRLKKITYTPEWRDGSPVRQPTAEEKVRGPKLLKVIRLESYEDTLNNLKLQRAEPVQTTLFPATDTPAIAAARQDYVLRYLLDVESRGSRSLLDVPAFQNPTAYTLDVKAPGSDQTEPQAVDLLETFNYLLGLRVHQVGAPQTLLAEFEHADHVEPGDRAGRLRLKGPLRKAATGPWWVRPVTGTLANGRRVLIIWRKLTADAAQDNLVLNAWFEKHDYSVRDTEFDFIYVNGDNNLENLRQPDETWKVQLIEEAFHRLLFAQ